MRRAVTVRVDAAGDSLRLGIRDDGAGGAATSAAGLAWSDSRTEFEALGAAGCDLCSSDGRAAAGTSLDVEPPLTESVGASD